MRILMITDSLGKGGKERRLIELIKGLVHGYKGIDICLVSLSDHVEYKYLFDLPIRFETLPRRSRWDLSIPGRLRKVIRSFKPDLIHSWGTMSSVYVTALNTGRRIPFINGVLADAHHGLTLRDKHYFRVKLTTPFTDVFVSNSLAGIKAYRVPEERSVCIYNGIDLNRFRNLPLASDVEREILGGPKGDRFIAGMVSTFDQRKDFPTFLKAAIELCRKHEDVMVLMVGGGPDLEKTIAATPEDLVGKRVLYTGKCDHVESVMQILDVGVLITNNTTHGEGVSNSIIEYMASGKPVIATSGGGTDEVVRDGWNGFLIPPADPDAIVRSVEHFMAHKDDLSTMGEHARQFAEKTFNVSDRTAEYVRLYEDLTSKKKGKRN